MTATTTTQETNGTATAMVPASGDDATSGGTISAFSGASAFESAQRMAKALAASSLVPETFRGNVANCLIALELSARIGCSAFAAMQNLDIIHGRPSWRAQFLIATVNASGKFTPIRFRWQGQENTPEWGCRAVAKDKSDGEECVGTLITLAIAKAENWSTKSGSKWLTFPEQMLMYRAAAFWTRTFAPELSLGMQTREEVIDTIGYDVTDVPAAITPGDVKALEATLLAEPAPAPETKKKTKASKRAEAKAGVTHTADGEVVETVGREPGVD